MKQDRFLMGILIFIGVLVVAAVVLFFVRNEKPAYGPRIHPKACSTTMPWRCSCMITNAPTATWLRKTTSPPTMHFHQAFLTRQLDTSTSALQIGNVQMLENGEAWVNVTIQYAGNGLLNNGWSSHR